MIQRYRRYAERVVALAATLFLFSAHPERYYAALMVEKYGGKPEVRLWDGTRVDLLTDTEAIEIDFARKWAEAIGQCLYYAEVTGKEPAIILLAGESDQRFVYRCQTVCAARSIKLYVEPE